MNAIELARATAIKKQGELKNPVDKNRTFEGDTKAKEELGKVFYARIAHSKFIFSDNSEAIFHFGRLEISPKTFPGNYDRPTGHGQTESKDNGRPKWLVYIEELEAICPPRANNPNIFTMNKPPEQLPDPKELGVNAVDESSLVIAEAALKKGHAIKVEQQTGPVTLGGVSDPAASTVDPELLRAAQRGGTSPLGNNSGPITPVNIEDAEIAGAARSSS